LSPMPNPALHVLDTSTFSKKCFLFLIKIFENLVYVG